jgi:tetratricopeptide (TPR) repeat protein
LQGALPLYKKAVKILTATLPAGHPEIASATFNLGGVYMETGDRKKARALYKLALDYRRAALPPGHHDIRLSEDALASVGPSEEDSGESDEL